MKRPNKLVTTALFILITVIAGAAVFYMTQSKKTNSNDKTAAPNSAVKPSEETTTYTNKELGFSFEYPKNWQANIQTNEEKNSVGTLYGIKDGYLESPNGNKLVVHYEIFGGGLENCVPADKDHPFQPGNACSSKQVLHEEKLPAIAQNTAKNSAAASENVYITDTKFASTDGKAVYSICFDRADSSMLEIRLKVKEEVSGAVTRCEYLGQGLNIYFQAKDEADLKSPDAEAVRKIMRSIKSI